MRIGLTYDLQTDPADPRQAGFDPPRTIRALTEALTQLGGSGSGTQTLALDQIMTKRLAVAAGVRP